VIPLPFFLVINTDLTSYPETGGRRFATREEAQAEADYRNSLHHAGPRMHLTVGEHKETMMKLKVIDVQPGDTLWAYAEQYLGHGSVWRDIAVRNAVDLFENVGDEMAKSLDILRAGTQIVVPVYEDDEEPFEPSGNV
jgi:hypothetical protein